ncbi:DUF2252 family protein [Ningiella sp. W23]|uniref:DUF2252 family protein n=1 Tax=Ningiella sp. W23 TaxID=3023715 RepID=UPI003756F8DA
MNKRADFINTALKRVDGCEAGKGNPKHLKMCSSPFVFFRGSAQIFYADLASGFLPSSNAFDKVPLTTIMGDCHTSNFGFFSEEGSFGEQLVFSLNDFDDACIGMAQWDLLRFLSSLCLVKSHCEPLVCSRSKSKPENSEPCKYEGKALITNEQVKNAMNAFLDAYTEVLEQGLNRKSNKAHFLDQCFDSFALPSALQKRYKKAKKIHIGGEHFLSKSSLAKAVDVYAFPLRFKQGVDKYCRTGFDADEIKNAFSPYFFDHILDVVMRKQSGTGSINMDRYYVLIGPEKATCEADLSLCHVVEIKQQREAAPIHYFKNLHHQNQLNPAHLTIKCQRRMQRKQDYVLDEAYYQKQHWLVRSRHHAKVGIDPEHIGIGDINVKQGGFGVYAAACGQELARAHCRGDRRSMDYEQAMMPASQEGRSQLISLASSYAQQVMNDWMWLCRQEHV